MEREAATGRIVVSYGNRGIAETDDGERTECQYRRSVGRPFCGDDVVLEFGSGNSAVVAEIKPRRNEFARAGNKGQKQVIAANLDRVLVVIAPSPAPSRDLVDRYLVAAHSLDIEPVLVLNKAELPMDEDDARGPLGRLDEYQDLGYSLIRTSCKSAPGLAELPEAVTGKTVIFAGQSGVGKSSLINALMPDLDLQTGELSRVTGKGTHTTTTTIMYNLPCGGQLIDSPGVWEYGLWKMSARELFLGFRDLAHWDGQCRFNDCQHNGEPGCAVSEAASAGEVREWRYQAYLRLLEQSRNS